MSEEIKIGDFVIICDTDQPSTRMIAIVENIVNRVYHCRYFSTYPRMEKPYSKNPTLVSDFGVKVVVSNGHFYAHPVRESKATYSDGLPRNWQQAGALIQKTRKKASDVYYNTRSKSKGEA